MKTINFYKYLILISAIPLSQQALGACVHPEAQNAQIIVGTVPDATYSPETSTIQSAVDMAKDCEFEIERLTPAQGETVTLTQGSYTIRNNNFQTLKWADTNNAVQQGDIIQFNGAGDWYEVKIVNNNRSITLTRPISLSNGTYDYKVKEPIKIYISPEKYITDNIDLNGLHYITLSAVPAYGYERPIIINNATSNGNVIQSKQADDYGHFVFDSLNIFSDNNGLIGITSTSDNNDINISIMNCSLLSAHGVDAIGTNALGDIVITDTRVESTNDVAFLPSPFTPEGLAPRSVFINNSAFLSTPNLGFQANNRKTLHIRGDGSPNAVTNESMYTVGNSYIAITTSQDTGTSSDIGLAFVGTSNAEINIYNLNAACTHCSGTGPQNNGAWYPGVISVSGSNTQARIGNSNITNTNSSCSVVASGGAIVTLIDTSVSYDNLGQPRLCEYAGGVINVQ